jgi:acyl-coenzyme A thioesterase PaaI-like protein
LHGGVIATILDEIMSWNAKGSVLEIVNEREATIEADVPG